MTAAVAESSGETDFFNSDTRASNIDAPLGADTDVSVDSEAEMQEIKVEEPAQGVFGRLFRRRKKEPTLQNGAADLLDNERPQEGQVDESSASESAEMDDEEEGESDDDEEEEESDEKSDDEEADSEEEDENSTLQQEAQDDFDAFADFAQAPKYDESDEDEDEMMSLIGGPKSTVAPQTANNRLGSSLTKFLGFQRKENASKEGDKEKQSLLTGNYETDEDDNVEEDERANQNQGLLRSSIGDTTDDSDVDDDDLRSEPGEYRLESFYPSDSYRDQPSHTNQQDLGGRIQGFGSQSCSALTYNHNAMDSSTNSGRFFVDNMSAMDIESTNERRGILNGVGKAVSNITQLIRNKRSEFSSDDQDKKRMLQYIAELEQKLAQKEREVQTWKERAEHLQLEVNWLKEDEEEESGDEESAVDEDGSENDDGQEDREVKERALIVFEGDADDASGEEKEETGVQEGTLIDVTPKKPVFDPLKEKKPEGSADKKVDDDMMEIARSMSSSDTPNGEKGSEAGEEKDLKLNPSASRISTRESTKKDASLLANAESSESTAVNPADSSGAGKEEAISDGSKQGANE